MGRTTKTWTHPKRFFNIFVFFSFCQYFAALAAVKVVHSLHECTNQVLKGYLFKSLDQLNDYKGQFKHWQIQSNIQQIFTSLCVTCHWCRCIWLFVWPSCVHWRSSCGSLGSSPSLCPEPASWEARPPPWDHLLRSPGCLHTKHTVDTIRPSQSVRFTDWSKKSSNYKCHCQLPVVLYR